MDVLSMHSLNQKGNQQPRQNKKKGINNRRGGKRKENSNNDKNGSDARGCKKYKQKINFPCNLCGGDHLTYLFPRIDEASKFIAQSLDVLIDPL